MKHKALALLVSFPVAGALAVGAGVASIPSGLGAVLLAGAAATVLAGILPALLLSAALPTLPFSDEEDEHAIEGVPVGSHAWLPAAAAELASGVREVASGVGR